ncbi:MAG: type II toxin-antitoxin system prevent-host-death family antitoxin [Gemmatimonadetes bacterium]|nr:type II toxin-antitoxin system prevent-host-death family antitoxin [Gemmatimonadota bacterium]
MRATAKDLRFHVKELLATVGRGEEVVITYRGRPCAKLVPIGHEPEIEMGEEETGAFGMWADYAESADVADYVRKLRRGRN